MRISFLEPARLELDEAVNYYKYEGAGLGEAFLSEVAKTLDRIARFPEAWPPLSPRTRRCQTRRFPFGIIYQKREADILIIAIAHLHRRPEYWRDRLAVR